MLQLNSWAAFSGSCSDWSSGPQQPPLSTGAPRQVLETGWKPAAAPRARTAAPAGAASPAGPTALAALRAGPKTSSRRSCLANRRTRTPRRRHGLHTALVPGLHTALTPGLHPVPTEPAPPQAHPNHPAAAGSAWRPPASTETAPPALQPPLKVTPPGSALRRAHRLLTDSFWDQSAICL